MSTAKTAGTNLADIAQRQQQMGLKFLGELGRRTAGSGECLTGEWEALSRTLLVSSGDCSKKHPRSRTFREVHRSREASVTQTGQFSGSF